MNRLLFLGMIPCRGCKIVMIHQLLTAFAPGAAISGQAAAIRDMLRRSGMTGSQIFAQHRDRRWPDPGLDIRRLKLGPRDWLIYHHGLGGATARLALDHLERVIFYYHNVTPAHYLRGYNDRLADQLQEGRELLACFRQAPVVWTDSAFNLSELRDLGFEGGTVIPLLVDMPGLSASALSPAGLQIAQRYSADGWVNWLFVGRLAPNKRQDALIRAFAYYHRLINPHSRLLLVGSSLSAPGYLLDLESLVAALGLQSCVVFAGAPTLAEGFGGYYRASSVFVCASEHEGFCLPLLEAMAFELPVVAYRATGVPCAVRNAGLLVDDQAPAVLAEAVHLLLSDDAMRDTLRRQQPARVAAHTWPVVEATIRKQLMGQQMAGVPD